jgi:hypothetical protein
MKPLWYGFYKNKTFQYIFNNDSNEYHQEQRQIRHSITTIMSLITAMNLGNYRGDIFSVKVHQSKQQTEDYDNNQPEWQAIKEKKYWRQQSTTTTGSTEVKKKARPTTEMKNDRKRR